jgi:hypothetical protein
VKHGKKLKDVAGPQITPHGHRSAVAMVLVIRRNLRAPNGPPD